MRIIGYHMSGNTLADSLGEVVSEDHLAWLAESPEDSIKIFYDLNYAVAQLARAVKMTQDEGRKLLDKGRLYFPPYQIGYISNKFVSVKHGFYKDAPFSNYADASQYDKSVEIKADDSPEYCIARAKEAQQIGEQVYNALRKIGLHPTTLTSPISAYQKEILGKMNLPTVDDIPPEASELAYLSCHGNWVETFIRGHWGKVYDYDISSAYPSEIAKLLDTRYGSWEHQPLYMPDAEYGYCRGEVTIDKPFSPIIFSADDNHNYTFVGTLPDYVLTKQQWDFINKHNQGEFQPMDCWWWIPRKRVKPLEVPINHLFKLKEEAEGLDREVIKRVMSGIWGKFLALQRGEMDVLFNSCWGAEVETRVGLRVAEFCLKAMELGINPISIAVDGVTVDKQMPDEVLEGL